MSPDGQQYVTKEGLAAKTYFKRLAAATDSLRARAFDLAMYSVDKSGYEANYNHLGEGGAYAERFRTWIEKNLDQGTVDLLDELIAEEKQTAEALKEHAKVNKEWREQRDKLSELRRKKAEKNGARVPKAPKARKVIKAVEAIEPTTEEDTGEIGRAHV